MIGIQRTIAICYEWHDDFKGKMKRSVKYSMDVYGISKKEYAKHRYMIRLFEHLYPELKTISSEAPTPSITVIKLDSPVIDKQVTEK